MSDPTHEEISERAHQLWERAGKPAGQDHDFWLQAERELKEMKDVAKQEPPSVLPG